MVPIVLEAAVNVKQRIDLMDITLADRTHAVQPSPTLVINARAKQLKASGGDIISLSVGEPDFDTPEHIKTAAIDAINAGFTRYTAVDGTAELKEAIVAKFEHDNQLNFTPDDIIVSTGAKQCLYNLTQVLINPGDEVIIPAPYWVSYPDMCKLAGAKCVVVKGKIQHDFKISPEQLEAAITPKTKLFILNSPSNPTGMIYSKQELSALAEVLLKHPHVLILTDDIYEHILWTHRPFTNLLTVCPELKPRTVVVNGVSKAYAMTGWRIGYAAGPKEIIAATRKIQSQSTSNPCSIAQKAAFAALNGNQNCVHEMAKEFKVRHDFVYQTLQDISGLEVCPSHGTFYTFPNIARIISQMPDINSDIDFAEALLVKTGVAVVPGTAFGDSDCIRISFALGLEKLDDALKRIKTFINQY